jgi:hypothetical protein
MMLNERVNNGIGTSTIPDEVWKVLFAAKCQDLGISSKSDK